MTMKRLATLSLVFAALWVPSAFAHSDGAPEDCFPACETISIAATQREAAGADHDAVASDIAKQAVDACGSIHTLVQQAEALNDQVKPVKEIVGYVRSPQALALKLVNDHLFKIPGWVGFALDPLGTIKHKAIDEIRARAKAALEAEWARTQDCGAKPAVNYSIDAA
jgi:hypothetical protein